MSSMDTKREVWSSELEFGLSLLGFCVGQGNIYRFPYLCLRNGGAAFLVPYFFFLFLIGISLFIMEMYLGQFSGLSCLQVWNLCPLFKGGGITLNLMSGVLAALTTVFISWCIVFIFMSFSAHVPWSTCGNWWNSDACFTYNSLKTHHHDNINTTNVLESSANTTTTNTKALLLFDYPINSSKVEDEKPGLLVGSAVEFFENRILGISNGVHDVGGVQWFVVMGNLIVWVVAFIAISKGVKSLGKIAYVTTGLPYVMLTVLVVRGVTLPGAADGLRYYLIPDTSKLLQFSVWYEALLQIFFTLGPGWGGLVTLSSHSKYDSNFFRNGFILSIGCCLTSFYGGFVTFSVLGFLAKESNQTVQEVGTSGPSLCFITYPEALAQMPFAPVWSIVFFIMLANVALEAIFVESALIIDSLCGLSSRLKSNKMLVGLVVCVIGFLFSLPFTLGSGMYWFQLLDWYVASLTAIVITLAECIAAVHCYGFAKISDDIESMIGKRPSLWYKINWGYISPIILVFMIVYSIIGMTTPSYGAYAYPSWSVAIAVSITLLVILPTPVTMVLVFAQQSGDILQRLKSATRHTDKWKAQTLTYDTVSTNEKAEQSV